MNSLQALYCTLLVGMDICFCQFIYTQMYVLFPLLLSHVVTINLRSGIIGPKRTSIFPPRVPPSTLLS